MKNSFGHKMIQTPKILHLEGSAISPGETAYSHSMLADQFLVIEEKIDAPVVGISFDADINISVNTDEALNDKRQFRFLYDWCSSNIDILFDLINDKFIMYGHYAYNKQSVFYDNLCSLFLESDFYDKTTNEYLSTARRHALIHKYAPGIVGSVPVVKIGKIYGKNEINSLITKSLCKTSFWKSSLNNACTDAGFDYYEVLKETDDSDLMQGLTIKSENQNIIVGRYQFIRPDYKNIFASNYMICNELGKK
jgi:hypothetical protein